MVAFLRSHLRLPGTCARRLRDAAAGGSGPRDAADVAFQSHAACRRDYGPDMDLTVEIDRGDVWYDFPFDGARQADRAAPRPLSRT